MREFESIRKDIQNRKFKPVYFLYGDEPYFIDKITSDLQQYVLSVEEKVFNEHIFYGNEVEMEDVVMQARQFPMMSEFQLVIVKEAQHLSKKIDKLSNYIDNPSLSTVLVFNYKYAKPDGRTQIVKKIKQNYVLAESAAVYENQIPAYIRKLTAQQDLQIDPKAEAMLSENIGNNLSRLHNEIDKLKIVLKGKKKITPELVERHIGISKDYNNFELTKAISAGNFKRAFEIVKYFGENPKDHSIYMTIAVLFNYFSKILILHTLRDKSNSAVASALKIPPNFTREYIQAARLYPIKKVTAIIGFMRDTDMKSKGVGASGSVTQEELMRELLYKIFTL